MSNFFLATTFIGEHLSYGTIGHIGVLTSFVFSVFACFLFWKQNTTTYKEVEKSYALSGSIFFFIQSLLLLCSFAILLFLIIQHHFEYKYVWQHSSKQLPLNYLLSSLWEGQEGSFLLWGLWNSFIGCTILIKKPKHYTAIMVFIALFQSVISSMLIGIHLGDIAIGNDPFILMRDFFSDAPIFSQPSYLSMITDGKGLNELLQNYWMVIHPPILFLGFALTILPFGYACVALWKGDIKDCLTRGLRSALLAAGILGLGIMMGGAWAYESLSFGGYWAWDPVENASLVPWLFLVAGIHSCIISIKKERAFKTTLILFACSFIFVLYSTYLTRSGVLGDTSVHSFTDLELNVQLILLILILLTPFLFLFLSRWNRLPKETKSEEHISSKEFWISTGTLILLFSALYISIATSLPVFNKLFGTQWAIGTDVEFAYNKWLIWIAIFILSISALSYFLKFQKTPREQLRKLLLPLLVYVPLSILLSVLIGFSYEKKGFFFLLFIHITCFSSLLSICLHSHYFIFISSKKKGGVISHIAFALLITGILISSANKKTLSYNYTGFMQNFGENSKENPMENITLIKDIPTHMPPYIVTYKGDSTHPSDIKRYFIIEFQDSAKKDIFRLYPNAYVNLKGSEGLMSNPDKKHYLWNDIFTYVTSIPSEDHSSEEVSPQQINVPNDDTVHLLLGWFSIHADSTSIHLYAKNKAGTSWDTTLSMPITKSEIPIRISSLSTTLYFQPNTSTQTAPISIKEDASLLPYVTLKVYLFPFINLVWFGVVLLFVGFILSWLEQKNRK